MALKIEGTPLYLARQAIDAAASDISDAMEAWREAWSEDRSNTVDKYPFGDFELVLGPDAESLGFEARFEFSEDPGPDASVFTRKLAAVLEKHGVATVRVIGVNLDQADVEAFNE